MTGIFIKNNGLSAAILSAALWVGVDQSASGVQPRWADAATQQLTKNLSPQRYSPIQPIDRPDRATPIPVAPDDLAPDDPAEELRQKTGEKVGSRLGMVGGAAMGAKIGLALGGPAGAAVGAVVGGLFGDIIGDFVGGRMARSKR
jgi:hypothetical protein